MSTRRSAIVGSALLLLLAAGCGGHSERSGAGASTSASPPQLTSIQELQRVFNSGSREPTLLVLVAPT